MAQWLGHLMAQWPAWLIGLVAIAIIVIGGVLLWYLSFAIHNIGDFHAGRNRNGEK